MPDVEQKLTKLAGSVFYGTFYLSHCCWKLPLHPSSQSSLSCITPDGIFSPTRVVHRTTNDVMFYNQRYQRIFRSVSVLIFCNSWMTFRFMRRRIPTFCKQWRYYLAFVRNLFLNYIRRNASFSQKRIRWCGQDISSEDIRFDPRLTSGIRHMVPPTNGAQLPKFVCEMPWMRSAISNFSAVIRRLSDLLDQVYSQVGKRTSLAAARLLLSALGWASPELDAFDRWKTALENQVTLTRRDNLTRVCVYTDASDILWSGILTPVPYQDLRRTHVDQRHHPLVFLSGHFTGPQLGWSIFEKE